jgi:hypothetical protein
MDGALLAFVPLLQDLALSLLDGGLGLALGLVPLVELLAIDPGRLLDGVPPRLLVLRLPLREHPGRMLDLALLHLLELSPLARQRGFDLLTFVLLAADDNLRAIRVGP